jgi:hypothetical protein
MAAQITRRRLEGDEEIPNCPVSWDDVNRKLISVPASISVEPRNLQTNFLVTKIAQESEAFGMACITGQRVPEF